MHKLGVLQWLTDGESDGSDIPYLGAITGRAVGMIL